MRRGWWFFLLFGLFLSPAWSQSFDGEAYLSFSPFVDEVTSILESEQGVAGGIIFYYLPIKRIVVGYRVSIVEPSSPVSSAYWTRDPRYGYPVYYCDFLAQYVIDVARNSYVQANPQAFTLKGLTPGASYHVVVTPLCIWPKSPFNVDERGKAFWYCWLSSRTFGWVYVDKSAWGLVMVSGDGGEGKRGYFEVYSVVFEGRVQAKKPPSGPGGKYAPM
ncbi:MAG: hypothetical protein N2205_04090 [Candidatus Caldatribacterium sp.]|uniref:hypothetical protein n=1 Tax=Candidatus Caldatribacterium sp. TaxID=2282143 RepID=UPI0029985989|nr:hypothetical protein [Candidatus Caldatribacterium sp.]MCX7730381.1 hypothetical protein [Candidatus Caldatribacterium sp.]MDW8081773.1 hypothetical protein [Candidatus Calescibacterium sp.]